MNPKSDDFPAGDNKITVDFLSFFFFFPFFFCVRDYISGIYSFFLKKRSSGGAAGHWKFHAGAWLPPLPVAHASTDARLCRRTPPQTQASPMQARNQESWFSEEEG